MASSQLGLRCALGKLSPVTMATTVAARRTLTAPRASWVSPSCLCAVPSEKRFAHSDRRKRRQTRDVGPAPSVQQQAAQQEQRMTAALINAPLPGTLLAPPYKTWPSGKAFYRFAYEVAISYGRRWLQTIIVALSSRPKPWVPWSRGLLKLNNHAIPPMAKGLYTDMMRAFAEGDRDKLQAICTTTYLQPMLDSIAKRPRTKRYKWEVVEWTGKARMVAQSITPVKEGGNADMIRQATVHLPSRQRRTEYEYNLEKREWEVVARKGGKGGELVDEYIILVAVIAPKTYKHSEWRVLSATRPSSVEEWQDEKELVEKVQSVDMEKYRL